MPIIGVSIVIQLLCAVHCVRHRRNNAWLMVIGFLSVPGCLAYCIFEVLPAYSARREVRVAKAAAMRKLDPQRELRAAREALDLADTAANRIALGDALVDLEDYGEACRHYRDGIARMPQPDRPSLVKLACAELEGGSPAEARAILADLPHSHSPTEQDRTGLLLARAHQACGDKEAALDIYAEIAPRIAGGEAQCRQAALLLEMGREGEAERVLAEVERKIKRIDKFERRQQREMYDWAERTLSELRTR